MFAKGDRLDSDWRDGLSGGHPLSQVKSVRQVRLFMYIYIRIQAINMQVSTIKQCDFRFTSNCVCKNLKNLRY